MANKNIVIEEDTRRMYNKARGMILSNDPSIEKLTDNSAMQIILKKFLGDMK